MTYARPQTLGEAVAALAERQAVVLAGGTDLYPAHVGRPLAGDIVDLTAIDELRGVSETAEYFRIGGATRWSDLIALPLAPEFDCLKAAAAEVGSSQIQNRATVAGNLCNASPAADGIPPLLALEAEVELASAEGTRRLPLEDFLTDYRKTALARGEILSAVVVRKKSGPCGSAFVKLGARRFLVISIVMVAAVIRLDGPRIAEARIAVGAASKVARRLMALEADLVGLEAAGPLSRHVRPEHLAPLSPIDDVRATAAYRLDASLALVGRALDLAAGSALRA